jgi:hypothetical protein
MILFVTTAVKTSKPTYFFMSYFKMLPVDKLGTGIGQSVKRRATGWAAGVRFLAGVDCSLLNSVQTGSGAHPAPYPIGTGGKAARA